MKGGCQCGALRYEVKGEPLAVYACHCLQCQNQSGSGFGLSLAVRREDFLVTKGEAANWSRSTERGTVTICHFCPACGTRLMHERAGTPRVVVKPGTLDETKDLPIAGHMWVSSAQSWLRPLLTGPRVYEEQPADIMVFAKRT